jgi:alginate O-acetyltransferase complex protein AlgI
LDSSWTFILQIAGPIVLGIVFAASALLDPESRLARACFLAAQLVLIAACGFATPGALAFVAVILLGYGTLTRMQRREGAGVRVAAGFVLAAYLVYWLVEKYLVPLGALAAIAGVGAQSHASALAIVGISYIGFKLIHFAVDRRDGEFGEFHPLEFTSWLLFFPSIVAGPMQRFQDWIEQRAQARMGLADVAEGLRRLVIGVFLKFVVADSIHGFSIAGFGPGALSVATFRELAAGAAVYAVYLYLDFSGYSHMAIGLGRFWGVKLPENFEYPFLARNLADFWNRWHISLSTILRDYLFYPLSLALKRRRFFAGHPDLAAALPPLITFAVAGAWHGAGLNFLIYGLIHGVGLGYLAVMRRRKSKSALARWWGTSRVAYALACLINFSYVAFSFLFFCLPTSDLAILAGRLG